MVERNANIIIGTSAHPKPNCVFDFPVDSNPSS